MLSRDADSCFWIGRYMERAEAIARMIDVHYHFALESPSFGEVVRWSSILAISAEEEDYRERYSGEDERSVLEFFTFDENNPSSIVSCVSSARANALRIRESISSEMWESINTTYLELRSWSVDSILSVSPHEFFTYVKNASHLFAGITSRTLMLGESRDFLNMGTFLERAGQTTRILDVKYHDLLPRFAHASSADKVEKAVQDPVGIGGPVDVHGWLAVLKSVGGNEAFRKTYPQGISPSRVTAFLVLNPYLPASVRFCIGRVEACLRRISGNNEPMPGNEAERSVGKLFSALNFITADEIIRSGLHEFLEEVQDACGEIGSAIAATYLQY